MDRMLYLFSPPFIPIGYFDLASIVMQKLTAFIIASIYVIQQKKMQNDFLGSKNTLQNFLKY